MFITNAYPKKIIDNVVDGFFRNCSKNHLDDEINLSTNDEEQLPYVLLRVPYFGKCSVKFANHLKRIVSNNLNVNVRAVYCTLKVKSHSPLYLLYI